MIGRGKLFRNEIIANIVFINRTNPDDVLRHFKPMKQKIANLYIDLQTATANGKIREVLKIQEKLKLLK